MTPRPGRRSRQLDQDRLAELDATLGEALATVRALDRDLALARARALDRDLDRGLDRGLDRALDLDLARARALDLDLARDLDLALDRALALDLDRALDLARDLDLALDRALALDLDRALDLTLDFTLARARARVVEVERALSDAQRRVQLLRAESTGRAAGTGRAAAAGVVRPCRPAAGVYGWTVRWLSPAARAAHGEELLDELFDLAEQHAVRRVQVGCALRQLTRVWALRRTAADAARERI